MTEPPTVLATALRILTFRASREELGGLHRRHLMCGLAATWIVGMGRYWDDPNAYLLQHLGLGSVVYVFALSGILWLLVAPLGPTDWQYQKLLTYVTLTSPPAILYAVPVERMYELGTARSLNAWFLAIVAAWRVALLVIYLVRAARLPWYSVVVGTLLPLTVVITTLSILNLEHAVYDIMAGMRDGGTANDLAYSVLLALTFLSSMLVIPLLATYSLIWWNRRSRRSAADGGLT